MMNDRETLSPNVATTRPVDTAALSRTKTALKPEYHCIHELSSQMGSYPS